MDSGKEQKKDTKNTPHWWHFLFYLIFIEKKMGYYLLSSHYQHSKTFSGLKWKLTSVMYIRRHLWCVNNLNAVNGRLRCQGCSLADGLGGSPQPRCQHACMISLLHPIWRAGWLVAQYCLSHLSPFHRRQFNVREYKWRDTMKISLFGIESQLWMTNNQWITQWVFDYTVCMLGFWRLTSQSIFPSLWLPTRG